MLAVPPLPAQPVKFTGKVLLGEQPLPVTSGVNPLMGKMAMTLKVAPLPPPPLALTVPEKGERNAEPPEFTVTDAILVGARFTVPAAAVPPPPDMLTVGGLV